MKYFHRYENPDSVGWLGYIEVLGEIIAFIDLGKRVHFVEEIEGWGPS